MVPTRKAFHRCLFTLTLAAATAIPALCQETTNRDAQIQEISTAAANELQTNSASPLEVRLDPKWMQVFPWRGIGPANMGGRVTDFAVVESDPTTFWVATAGGGLLKTTNNGTTFEHQF